MDHYKLFIDGEFVEARDGKTFESIDPGTGLPIATVERAGRADAEAAIEAARRAFDRGEWSGLDPAARGAKIYDFADRVMQQGLRLAVTESMDSGQVIGLAKFMPMLGSGILRNLAYFASTKFPWEEEIPYSGNVFAPGRDFIRREPVGVCVGIIPWNFPMSMAFWKISHAIIMGNTIVLKPAPDTPWCAAVLGEITAERTDRSMRRTAVHTSFATPWQCACCKAAPRCMRSVKSCVIKAHRAPLSTPG